MSSVIERFYSDELNEARKEARIEGQNDLSSLLDKLFKENRIEDVQRVVRDEVFRRKLLNEMFPQEANP